MRELFECINEYPFISLCLAMWICIIVCFIFNKEWPMCVVDDDYEPSESLLDGDFSCETTEVWKIGK